MTPASKAAIGTAPSKKKRVSHLGALETPIEVRAADNMKPKPELRDLNFKVDPEFHLKFKMTATAAGLSMKEFVQECYEAWVDKQKGR